MKTSCPRASSDSLMMQMDVTTPSLVGNQLSVIIAILMIGSKPLSFLTVLGKASRQRWILAVRIGTFVMGADVICNRSNAMCQMLFFREYA